MVEKLHFVLKVKTVPSIWKSRWAKMAARTEQNDFNHAFDFDVINLFFLLSYLFL